MEKQGPEIVSIYGTDDISGLAVRSQIQLIHYANDHCAASQKKANIDQSAASIL